jgi:hypothetical protein
MQAFITSVKNQFHLLQKILKMTPSIIVLIYFFVKKLQNKLWKK